MERKKWERYKKIRITSQPSLFDLTKTLTMKKFTFFSTNVEQEFCMRKFFLKYF
jgi:hypothetical protein